MARGAGRGLCLVLAATMLGILTTALAPAFLGPTTQTARAATTPPIGCPGGPAGPVSPTAPDYDCPGGGRVIGGVYYAQPGLVGRIQGRITYSYANQEGPCVGSEVRVTRTQAGDILPNSSTATTTNSSDGNYILPDVAVSPGQVVLVVDACHSGDGSIYRGQSGTITVQPNKSNIVDFTVTQPITLAGQSDALCDQADSGAIGWLLCSVGQFLLDGATRLDAWVLSQLSINTTAIFNDDNRPDGSDPENNEEDDLVSSNAFRTAWSLFRNIAYALLVVLGLVMIISQIMGLDIFDAYTIRKMLPKLVLAAVFIPLLWPILGLLFNMSNDAALAMGQIIARPFENVGGNVSISALLLGAGGVGGAAVYFAIGGWGVFLAVLATVLLVVLSAIFILAARDIVAYVLIIFSSVAVVSAAFEPFKKLFTLWRTLLITILLSVPAIAAVLAASKAAAKIAVVTDENWGVLLAMVFLISGYALFWKVFQQLDKVAGQLGNLANSVTSKAQKALTGYRADTTKRRYGEAVEGRRNLMRGFGWTAGVGRRAKMAEHAGMGAFGVGKKGRAKYAEAVRTMQAGVAAKALDQDHDRAAGDDDAMQLLSQRGMTESRFLKEYAAIQEKQGVSKEDAQQRARNALGLTQTSFGVRAGTSAMRIAAMKSLLKSNTSYRYEGKDAFENMTKAMYGDVGGLVKDRLVTASDGAAMIKSNGARADRAGVGFGKVIQTLDQVAREGVGSLDKFVKDPKTGMTKKYVTTLADEALKGTGPGQLIGQRHEAIRVLGPEMLRRAGEAYTADGNKPGPQFIQQVAASASRRDLAGQLPELNAELNAEKFAGQEIAGRTMAQWEEYFRNGASQEEQAVFQEYRREYSTAWQRSMATREPTGDVTKPPGT